MNRREILASIAATPFLFDAASALARDGSLVSPDMIEEDLRRYIAFGSKASGGAGDNASGEWIAGELARAGYKVERSTFEAPFFEPDVVELRAGGSSARLIAQAIVKQTPGEGVEGRLFRFDPLKPEQIPSGALVLVDLPRQGWSTATAPIIRKAVKACEDAGANGAILVTNGPTGEAIALNAPGDEPLFSLPTACLAPRDAGPFFEAAGKKETARLFILGRAGRRGAFNIAGRWSAPGGAKTVIVTTPRSGWMTCAAERGPGIAIWLDLMRWLPTSGLALNVIFSSNSGHEYENLGASHQIGQLLPQPRDTALFLLFGASVVTKATQEYEGRLSVLPDGTAPRSCIVTAGTDNLARSVLAGWEGWADPAFVTDGGAGEAGTAIRAGYPNVIGFIGSNPYHHVAGDTGGNVDSAQIRAVALASRELLRRI
ncbi:hypothetical protein EDF57_104423 [Novosphingobium sp. PhB55]|uniref:hypothetical protein n=1 Tax=Novosphingobium sp. PhB55 TaxID=2485106 RepID=UPI001066B58D|nr:hypothetical protein [Novosphingobium sp. PhB55]TDW64624.1 hypothetical protein EDF57_104423 [Novosphingobium sp. PhB55]